MLDADFWVLGDGSMPVIMGGKRAYLPLLVITNLCNENVKWDRTSPESATARRPKIELRRATHHI